MNEIAINTLLTVAIIAAIIAAMMLAPPEPEFDGWNDEEIEAYYHQMQLITNY
jgi:hypothetical protein